MTADVPPIPFPAERARLLADVDLARIREAARRIEPHVRATPVMYASLPTLGGDRTALWLKLENLQVGGGPQVRGVLNAALSLPRERINRGLVSVYEGAGHSPALAYVGRLLDVPVTILVAEIAAVSQEWAEGLEAQGAHVLRRGALNEVGQLAVEYAAEHGMAFLSPSIDSAELCGLGTLGLELLQAPLPPSVVVVPALAGGGLLNGVAAAIKSVSPETRVVGVEVAIAPHFYQSFQAGHPVTLGPGYSPLTPRRINPLAFDLARRYVDEIVLISPQQLQETVHLLWRELEVSTSTPAAYAVASVLAGKVTAPADGALYAIVAGIGEDGLF